MASQDLARGPTLDDLTHALSGWPRRWMFLALSRRSMCVKELTHLLGFDKSTISRNLALLESCGLLRSIRDGSRKNLELTEHVDVTMTRSQVTITIAGSSAGKAVVEFRLDPDTAARFDRLVDGP